MATEEPQPSTASLNPMPSSTFSFTAPFPLRSGGHSSAKQRRVSLPSSPRLSPAPGWPFRDEMGLEAMSASTSASVGGDKDTKFHKIELASIDLPEKESIPPVVEKKPRKKWTEEETQMLVEGCNKWGVGNWKVILNDPELAFDNRSPVDLKDRFRTFFPDAYKQHYPNAKTHLSSKVRASLPDGTSIFEKTRSKKRRPFTPEEDEALKRGYDKHGTVWASILKDPVFQAKNRRSTDLRDRFRNAFPDLYEAAGYKPRNNSKKKKLSEGIPVPTIPAEMSQEEPREVLPKWMPRRKRASTAPASRPTRSRRGILDSATCSDSEENSSGDEELRGRFSESPRTIDESKKHTDVTPQPQESGQRLIDIDKAVADSTMASCSPPTDSSGPLSLPEAPEPPSSQTWTGWVASSSSPTRRPPSDVFLSSQTTSPTSMVFGRRNAEHTAIGNSAWATEEWLSPNPRLEPYLPDSSSSSFIEGPSPVPSSPFSFSMSSHGVMDRYDLFPATFATHNHGYTASEIGLGDRDTHSAFSEADMFNATASYRGFTHHSNSAGDLIFAVGRSQPLHLSGSLGLQNSRSLDAALEGRRMGIPHLGLPGIDEIPLSAISLHDRVSSVDTDMEDSDIIHSRGTSSPPAEGMVVPPDLDFNALPLEGDILASTPTSLTNPISPIDLQSPASITVSKTRPSSAHAHTHLGSSQFRSFSQPPTDHRTHPGPPPHAHTSPFPSTNTIRTQGVFDTCSLPSEIWRAPNDFIDLPFLDLHYYKSNSTQMALLQDAVVESAQALDLAGWGTSTSNGIHNSHSHNAPSSPHPISIAPSLLHAIPTPGPSEHHSLAQAQLQLPSSKPRSHPRAGVSSPPPSSLTSSFMRPSSHHRVQSAVSPDDLIIKKLDNKRKRASWDGGAAS